ncbi:MAG: efflux RND transporter permease subunit [Bacteroidales bacterium]
MKHKFKEFKPTSWSIDNKTSIYVLAVIISIFGLVSYNSIPKEQFPEIVIPTYLVQTVYPGTSPADIENLVTKPLEKRLKSINGIKKITSNSVQDFSMIAVEFQTGIELSEAKQKVKDEVDKAKRDLPNDLASDPEVIEISLSEIPIMYINISGKYGLDRLKKYAELMQERIEGLKEITRVDMVGALDREIQINVDMFKMQAAALTFNDISAMISRENLTLSGGSIDMEGMRRSIRVVGEFKDLETLKNIVVSTSKGAHIYLKDIAEIKDTYAERDSYARLNGNNVITLNVIKKGGENLLDASDKIKEIQEELVKDKFPKDLDVIISGDQSTRTRTSLFDLNNTIIIGFILVTIVLMFFMGLTNAMFVGLSVPLSMFLAYIVMPGIGFTMNMLVMFSFIFALGIVVDDAIVVIENTHRIFKKTGMDIATSAKVAAGEVFAPILSGTLTTLAPFFPLAFWPGTVGKFMFFIPVTLIITLFASLIVAYIINPVFAVSFMKHSDDELRPLSKKRIFTTASIFIGLGAVVHLIGSHAFANLLIFIGISFIGHNLFLYKVLYKFQHQIIPAMLNKYEKFLGWILEKRRPYYLLYTLFGTLILTFFIMGIFPLKVVFFPDMQPSTIYTVIKLPVGTDVKVTDSITHIVEQRVIKIVSNDTDIVESVLANVAKGVAESGFDFGGVTPHIGKVTVNFVEFGKRNGKNTEIFMDSIRNAIKDITGAEITVTKPQGGPPTGKPINIEVTSDDFMELLTTTDRLIRYLDSINIPGIEELKTDFDKKKPEILIEIDRVRANREGISTAQIGMELRNAFFGQDRPSKFRDGEDQYPIQIRYRYDQRTNIDKIMNTKITFMDMTTGRVRQIPLSAVARISYPNSYGGINRKNSKRIVNVTSNVLGGYNANEIVAEIEKVLPAFAKSDKVDVKITGEQEDQKESAQFLSIAMLLSLFLIMFIMITQFNSLSKPLIIVSEVLFSLIGVGLGFIITRMPISIIMTGMGVVALAGIVVRNGILLVEFTDILLERGLKTRDAIIQAGKTRITPVLLTATATILGLVPLAIGFNIDFIGLFENFRPHIHFGGDNVAFFGPLSWTIIFGLSFATFLTLIFIPVMYFIMYAGKVKMQRKMGYKIKKKEIAKILEGSV